MINIVTVDFKERVLDKNIDIKDSKYKYLHIYDYDDYFICIEEIRHPKELRLLDKAINIPSGLLHESSKGIEQTMNILRVCDILGITSPACDYCVSRGGYLGTVNELNLLIPHLKLLKMNKIILQLFWSSTTSSIIEGQSMCFGASTWFSRHKTSPYRVFPLYTKI